LLACIAALELDAVALNEINRWGNRALDWISKEFLLAVCGSLLVALIAVSLSRPLVQGPPQQAIAYGAHEAEQSDKSFGYSQIRSYIEAPASYCISERPNAASEWRKKFICESKITDVVIAFLTFFLMIFTGLLVRVGYKQEQTTRRQMRAFVYLDTISIYNIAPPINPLPGYQPTGAQLVSREEGPLAIIRIKNTGNTPAYQVRHRAVIAVGPYPREGKLPPIDRNAPAPYASLPPGGITTKMIKAPHPLTDAQILGVRTGTIAIWVYGEIQYRTAFRQKRKTEFRLFHNSITGTTGISTEMTWAEGGNDAN
jgi:hypothetical protein